MTRVLMVVSAATYWTLADGTRHPTGFWGEELALPHRLFTRASWQVSLATPGGVPPWTGSAWDLPVACRRGTEQSVPI